MGTTYYCNKEIPLFGVHVCSKCQSVIVREFSVKIASASTWSRNKAMEAATEAGQKVLKALEKFNEAPFLVTETYKERSFTTGYEMEIHDANGVCPFCGAREKWQREYSFAQACKRDVVTGVALINEVEAENCMKVFSALEGATTYSKLLLIQKSEQFKKQWNSDPYQQQKIQNQISDLKFRIKDLQNQKELVKEKSHRLFELLQKKETEMKGYSLFSSERKTAKAEHKDLNKQYNAQREADLAREKELADFIANLEKQKKEICVANPGVMNELETASGTGKLREAFHWS